MPSEPCASAWMMLAEALTSCPWTLMEHSGKFRLAMLRQLVHNLVHCSGAGLKKPSLFKGIDA
ncbi:hypothetical protein DBY65_019080 [Pseudomonas sp. RIT412]|nr:hypothetical protein DBP26_007015 [Pseudomonas sp. RIT 409]RAU51910.1 hypothetical protein DBY65_019080 [Pseudomonas sp. RIT 412]